MRKAMCPEPTRSVWFRAAILLFFFIPETVLAYSTNYRFTGKPLDKQTDLYYFDSRYYNPEIGRFIQPDPLQNFLMTPDLKQKTNLELEDVLKNPQALNFYSYSLNNPVNLIDPTGLSPHVSQARQERFDKISDYIRHNEDYWLVRDRDGNAPAMDLIWQKSLELSQDKKGKINLGRALDTFYDAVHIDWAHDNVLDKSEDDFRERYFNLPSSLGGVWGGDRSQMDKLQHFAASARLAYKYGPRIAGLIGRLKEVKDGIKAVFDKNHGGYKQLKQNDDSYSRGDILANQAGIFWLLEYQRGRVNPSIIINNW